MTSKYSHDVFVKNKQESIKLFDATVIHLLWLSIFLRLFSLHVILINSDMMFARVGPKLHYMIGQVRKLLMSNKLGNCVRNCCKRAWMLSQSVLKISINR